MGAAQPRHKPGALPHSTPLLVDGAAVVSAPGPGGGGAARQAERALAALASASPTAPKSGIYLRNSPFLNIFFTLQWQVFGAPYI